MWSDYKTAIKLKRQGHKTHQMCFILDKGTPCLPSWIWQWPRQSQSSLPGRFRRNSTLSSARRTRRQELDISRRLGKRRLLLHGWAKPKLSPQHHCIIPLSQRILSCTLSKMHDLSPQFWVEKVRILKFLCSSRNPIKLWPKMWRTSAKRRLS